MSNGQKANFICTNNCGRMYKNKGTLQRHLKYECGIGNGRRFKCNVCDKSYTRKESLKVHLGMVHKLIDFDAVDFLT